MSPRPLVLVPGACLGGWAWHDVAARLRALGHDVYPVTLTGLGERVHLARPDVDLDTHIADVAGVLDYEDLHDAVLVGHSYSGIVVTGAADRRPERLDAVVYLDCSPLPSGMSLADVQTPEQRECADRPWQDLRLHLSSALLDAMHPDRPRGRSRAGDDGGGFTASWWTGRTSTSWRTHPPRGRRCSGSPAGT